MVIFRWGCLTLATPRRQHAAKGRKKSKGDGSIVTGAKARKHGTRFGCTCRLQAVTNWSTSPSIRSLRASLVLTTADEEAATREGKTRGERKKERKRKDASAAKGLSLCPGVHTKQGDQQ